MQADAKAAAAGKSLVLGVTRHSQGVRWIVTTLLRWDVKQRHMAYACTKEEAEAIARAYHPRLQAAAAEGRIEEEFAAVKAELRSPVRCTHVPCSTKEGLQNPGVCSVWRCW